VAAEALGLGEAMSSFKDEASPVSDALAYCDLTTGPRGQPMQLGERLEDIEARYGAPHVVVEALRHAFGDLKGMMERTEQRLALARAGQPVQ
jgi:hypothetical protein